MIKDSPHFLITFYRRFDGLCKSFGFRAWIKSWGRRPSFEEQPLHVKVLLLGVANTTRKKRD
jgi:hypothetical protein